MKIDLNNIVYSTQKQNVLLQNSMNSDERIVRRQLVQVWTKTLEKYARPGAHIPPVDILRRELLETGVAAAIEALVSEHWFLFSFMVRGEIEEQVGKELDRFDLQAFIEDVKIAQNDPWMLNHLREQIRRYVVN